MNVKDIKSAAKKVSDSTANGFKRATDTLRARISRSLNPGAGFTTEELNTVAKYNALNKAVILPIAFALTGGLAAGYSIYNASAFVLFFIPTSTLVSLVVSAVIVYAAIGYTVSFMLGRIQLAYTIASREQAVGRDWNAQHTERGNGFGGFGSNVSPVTV
jgi:hypothetical protein